MYFNVSIKITFTGNFSVAIVISVYVEFFQLGREADGSDGDTNHWWSVPTILTRNQRKSIFSDEQK